LLVGPTLQDAPK